MNEKKLLSLKYAKGPQAYGGVKKSTNEHNFETKQKEIF